MVPFSKPEVYADWNVFKPALAWNVCCNSVTAAGNMVCTRCHRIEQTIFSEELEIEQVVYPKFVQGGGIMSFHGCIKDHQFLQAIPACIWNQDQSFNQVLPNTVKSQTTLSDLLSFNQTSRTENNMLNKLRFWYYRSFLWFGVKCRSGFKVTIKIARQDSARCSILNLFILS